MKTNSFIIRIFIGVVALCLLNAVQAAGPLWTLTPLTATTIAVPSNDTAIVEYLVENESTTPRTLSMQPIPGVTQLTTGVGICGLSFALPGKAECTLSLQIDGSLITRPIDDGPVVCANGSEFLCYRPALDHILRITQAPPVTDATISVTGSPLTLTTHGPTGTLTINNMSLIVAATNITSNFTGTALDGNVTETGNTCANIAPQASCILTYTPGSTEVLQTNFLIQGSNTNEITAAMQIDEGITLSSVSPTAGAASGGTAVTLTGVGFTDATGVTFGGVAATSVNVVDSTTVTAVTPAHALGAVDVVISAPAGESTLANGYTYFEIGQMTSGGVVACLNGGLNNLIAATTDNSRSIVWAGLGVNQGATSTTNGASNTEKAVASIGANDGVPYATQLCNDFEVDSQGNTPCDFGNTCYNDWFLPAGGSTTDSGQLNCLYVNRAAIVEFFDEGLYWSSTTVNGNHTSFVWTQHFGNGDLIGRTKNTTQRVRCVRSLTP